MIKQKPRLNGVNVTRNGVDLLYACVLDLPYVFIDGLSGLWSRRASFSNFVSPSRSVDMSAVCNACNATRRSKVFDVRMRQHTFVLSERFLQAGLARQKGLSGPCTPSFSRKRFDIFSQFHQIPIGHTIHYFLKIEKINYGSKDTRLPKSKTVYRAFNHPGLTDQGWSERNE